MANDPNDPLDPKGAEGAVPSVNDSTLKAIQEMSAKMQEMASFSKQLVDSINSITKPMSQLSDLNKAIAEQTKATVASMKEIGNQVKEQVSGGKERVDSEAAATQAVIEHLTGKESLSEIEQKLVDMAVANVANHHKISELYKDQAVHNMAAAEAGRMVRDAKKAELDIVTALGEEKKKQYQEWAAAPENAGKARTLGTASKALTGAAPMEAIEGIGKKLLEIIPAAGGIGGIIGLMLAGRMEDAKFDAIGQVAAQAFDRIGGSGKAFAADMGHAARELSSRSMAAEGDLAQITTAFASTGMSAKEAMAHIEGFSSILGGSVGSSLVVASLAADKALELPAGTMAKMSGTMAQGFNTSAKDAFTQLMNIGSAAEKAGMDMTTFMSQTMEASGALRMLHANGMEVGEMQLGMAQKMQKSGLSAAYSQQYAAAGVQSAAQGIAGLGVGLSAVIGEKMGLAPGGGGGLDAWYAMKSGQKEAREGGASLSPEKIAGQLADMARENGRGRAEQVYFLTQLTGTTVAGAEATLDVGDSVKTGKKPSKESLEKMRVGLSNEAEKTEEIGRFLKEIRDGMLHIGSGLLGMVIDVLKAIFHVVAGGFNWIMGERGEGSKSARYFSAVGDDMKNLGDHAGEVVDGAVKAGAGVIKILGLDKGWVLPDDDKKAAKKSEDPDAPHEKTTEEIITGHGKLREMHQKKTLSKRGQTSTTVKVEVAHHEDGNKRYGN